MKAVKIIITVGGALSALFWFGLFVVFCICVVEAV